MKHLFARFHLRRHSPTVLAEAAVTHFGLPTFLRFARSRVIGIPMAMIVLEIGRETAQTAKGWPFSVPASRGRALAVICNNQQSASDVRGLKLCSRRMLHASPVFNPRSRVSALLIVARDRGTRRVWLIVADNRRSATARGWNGKWPTFFDLRRFASNFRSNLSHCNARDAKPRKSKNGGRPKGVGCRLPPTLSDCAGKIIQSGL